MAKPYPNEFRDDVVAVARKGQAPLAQVAKDFGISEGPLSKWLKRAEIEDGHRLGLTDADRAELRAELTATAPNRVWLTASSEHPTREGKLYICAVKDVYPNRIVVG